MKVLQLTVEVKLRAVLCASLQHFDQLDVGLVLADGDRDSAIGYEVLKGLLLNVKLAHVHPQVVRDHFFQGL
jgi:hypothetical protein